jgi:RNA polymerase sigma-70 factor (ECF subfamily)
MQQGLVEAARQGDHEAFRALATSAAGRLYAIAWCILRDTALAEDAVQETLFRAWQQLPRLRNTERWDAWLHRMIVNACTDQGRRRRRLSVEVRVSAEQSQPDMSHMVADRDELERGFRRLKPDQRAAIVLRYYVGLPVGEVAEALGVPLGTAKSRIHLATEALRAALAADARSVSALTAGRTS